MDLLKFVIAEEIIVIATCNQTIPYTTQWTK